MKDSKPLELKLETLYSIQLVRTGGNSYFNMYVYFEKETNLKN